MRAYELPVIAPAAIQAYLGRDLGGYDFLKEVPYEALAEHARGLGYRYITEPRISQLVCNIIAAQEPRYIFYKDMGGGKSKTVIDIIRRRKARHELQRALITVPEYIHIDAWKEQLREHGPDLRSVILTGDKDERYELIDKKADVYLINNAGLPVYMAETKGKRGKSHKGVETEAAGLFSSLFNFVLFEEIHRLRDWDSLTFKLFRWLATAAPFAYETTGTPFGRNPMPLWPQFQLIDDGATFGSLGMFRAAFFHAKKRYFGKRFAGYDYKFNKVRTPSLHRLMKGKSIVYDRTELQVELPHRTSLSAPVRMTKEMRMYKDRIDERMKEGRGDYASLDNVFTRYRQLASGFIALKADDESRIEVELKPNPKIEALRQVVTDMPAGSKFLLFYHFHYSGHRVRALLDEMKVPWATLYGRSRMQADGLRHEGQYERFLSDPRCLAFVLQDQAGSEAINPHKVCHYLWFYERPDDPLISEQAENRVDRPGKSDAVFIGDIFVQGTVEEDLLKYVKEGRDLRKAVTRGEVAL